MLHRWSSDGNTLHQPHPQIVTHKLLGGVDQATLRQSLTRGDSDQLVIISVCRYAIDCIVMCHRYASDGEVWPLSDDVLRLESCQVLCSAVERHFSSFLLQEELVASDVIEVMMTLQTMQKIFHDILQNPSSDACRMMDIESWCRPHTPAFKIFACVGFLSMDNKLFLSTEE